MRILFSGPTTFVAAPAALRCLEPGGSSTIALPAHGAATLLDALPLADGRVAAVFDDKALIIYVRGADGWVVDGGVRNCAKKPAALSLLAAIPAIVIGETSGDVLAFPAAPERTESRGVLTHTSSTISALATAADGTLLYSGDTDGRIKVTRVADLRLEAVCLGRTAAAVTAISDAGPGLVVSGAADGWLSLWSPQTGALLEAAPISSAGDASLPPSAAAPSRAPRSAAAPSVVLAVFGPGSDGSRLVACAITGAPRLDVFTIAPAAGSAGVAAPTEGLLKHTLTLHCAGGVQALVASPASVADVLVPGRVSSAAPVAASAILLVLCSVGDEAGSGTLRIKSIDLTAAVASPDAVGGGEIASDAALALAAIDWGAVAP